MNPLDQNDIAHDGEVRPKAKATVAKVTRSLSGNHVLDVHFLPVPTAMSGAPKGPGARVVILPNNIRSFADDPARPHDSGYERLLALSFHESAHQRFTDLEAYSNGSYVERHVEAYRRRVDEVGEPAAADEMPTEAELRSELFRALMNIIEDARVDRISLEEYPGTEKKMRGLHDRCTHKYREKMEAGQSSDLETILFAASDASLAVALPGCERLPLPGWLGRCIEAAEGEVRAGVLSADYAEAIDHTVLAYLAIRKQLQGERQENNTSGDSEEPSQRPHGSPGGNDRENDPEEPSRRPREGPGGDHPDDEPDRPDNDEEADTRSEGHPDAETAGRQDPPPIGPDDLTNPLGPQRVRTRDSRMAAVLSSSRSRVGAIAAERPKKEFEDLERVVRLSEALLAAGIEEYRKARESLGPMIRESAARLRYLLVASGRVGFRDGFRTGNRLSSRKLYRVAIPGADLKLCERRHTPETFDYAVSLVIDLSGSMSAPDGTGARPRIVCARDAMILLAEVLSQAEVSFEMLGFTTDSPEFVPAKVNPVHDEPVHVLFKEYDEPMSDDVRTRIGAIRAWANNYDGVAVRLAAKRLLQRPERSKMMFVASDGMPVGHYEQPVPLRGAVVAAERRGIMVFGIGIGHDGAHVSAYYDRSAVIEDASKLGHLILDMVEESMKKHVRSSAE